MYKIGFIGCGNMAKAMINGIIEKGVFSPQQIAASDVNTQSLEAAAKEYGIAAIQVNTELANQSEIIVLAVKPRFYEDVIKQIKPFASGSLVLSITPGISLEKLGAWLGGQVKIARLMPNTPAMVGEGMTAYCLGGNVNESEKQRIETLLQAFGRAQQVEEYMMEAVVAVSGSSPAYVFMFIEAMADAAVKEGLPRDVAYTMAAQAVLGSAKMLLESGQHPAELKDMVCSPAGTTIEAVKVLEEKGFRGAVMAAMEECAKKARELG